MVCLIVDEKGKIRKFQSIERADKFMVRHEGIYFLIEPSIKFIGIAVIESKNGEIRQIKSSTISRYS